MDLNELFYNGVPGSRFPAPEDARLLLARFGDWFWGTDTDVLPRSALEAALEEYLGLGLEDTLRIRLTWPWVPETDCYYHPHGDTNAVSDTVFPFLYGYSRGDRVYLLYDGWSVPYFGAEYPLGCDYVSGVFRLELERVGDRVRFISNQRVLTNGRAYEAEPPQPGAPCPENDTGEGLDVTKLTLVPETFESPEAARAYVDSLGFTLRVEEEDGEREEKYPIEILLEREYPGYGTLLYGEMPTGTVHGSSPYFFFIAGDGRLYRLPLPLGMGTLRMARDGLYDADTGRGFALQENHGWWGSMVGWWMHFTETVNLAPVSKDWTGPENVLREKGGAQWTLYLPTMEVFIRFFPEEA